MKISQIGLSVLLAVGTTDASNLKLRALQEEDPSPIDVINSEECKPYMDAFEKEVEDLMIQKESNVAAFVCNPLQRKKNKLVEKKMEEVVAGRGDGEVHPCILAGDKLLLKSKQDIKKALRTTKDCKKEVHSELLALKAQEGERMLTEDGHRRLPAAGLLGTTIGGGSLIGAAAISKKRRRNRKLASVLDYESIEDVVQMCKDEDYSLFLYIENVTADGNPHMNMVAKPSVSNKDGCKDALNFDDYDLGERLISFLEDTGFGGDWQEKAFSLGNFALGQMMAAADSAKVITPFQFHILTNNCATFVIEMVNFLKIPINKEVQEYVVNALVTSPNLVQDVMGSTEVVLGPAGEPLEEHKEAMRMFVSQYIEDTQK